MRHILTAVKHTLKQMDTTKKKQNTHTHTITISNYSACVERFHYDKWILIRDVSEE